MNTRMATALPDVFVMPWAVIFDCGRDLRAAAWWAWMRAGRLA